MKIASVLQKLPRVFLHEHLDGVLRPGTVIELAQATGYRDLPTNTPSALGEWFFQGANQGSLARYLEGLKHTIAVMQTEEALERVAYEQAEDLAKDGVVYFETRLAPICHTSRGLTHQQVVSSVLKGLARGQKDYGVRSGHYLRHEEQQPAQPSASYARHRPHDNRVSDEHGAFHAEGPSAADGCSCGNRKLILAESAGAGYRTGGPHTARTAFAS